MLPVRTRRSGLMKEKNRHNSSICSSLIFWDFSHPRKLHNNLLCKGFFEGDFFSAVCCGKISRQLTPERFLFKEKLRNSFLYRAIFLIEKTPQQFLLNYELHSSLPEKCFMK
jgi:hypothetical protein